jgi:hypothetical protein
VYVDHRRPSGRRVDCRIRYLSRCGRQIGVLARRRLRPSDRALDYNGVPRIHFVRLASRSQLGRSRRLVSVQVKNERLCDGGMRLTREDGFRTRYNFAATAAYEDCICRAASRST